MHIYRGLAKAALVLVASLPLQVLCNAQIPGLCNTGQTAKSAAGCTGALVTPNPPGGGPTRDGNWLIAHPYPSNATTASNPCALKYERTWVDSPNGAWLPNSSSTASEWITPEASEDNQHNGYYVYATTFPVPDSVNGGAAPTAFTINGRLASDNATVDIYLETPAGSGTCLLVSGQTFPVNPAGQLSSDFQQWWPFSFTNSQTLAVASPALLYFVVQNYYDPNVSDGESPTGLRVEFLSTSSFN